jgi:hypothetical protein
LENALELGAKDMLDTPIPNFDELAKEHVDDIGAEGQP